MKNLIFVLLVIFGISCAAAQQRDVHQQQTELSIGEKAPVPPGGTESFMRWVRSNYELPSEAKKARVSGQVVVQFVVDTEGALIELEVLSDLGYGTGAAAIRLLAQSPKWKPGLQDGTPVRVQYQLPVQVNMARNAMQSTSAAKALKSLSNRGTVPVGMAVIYGNFVQRLGFSSGGLSQDIYLLNLLTEQVVTLRVKKPLKSSKENIFCYLIEPGEYAIIQYQWSQSKWYGTQTHVEPIWKNQDESERFVVSIPRGTLYYIGTWYFDTEAVYFTDDQQSLDTLINDKYRKLDMKTVVKSLPR